MATIQLSFKPKSVSQKMLNSLNPRTRDIIERRYGLNPENKKNTLESIGKSYSITRERVRQIEDNTLNNIKKSKEYKANENVFDELANIVKELGYIIHEDVLMERISNDKSIHNHINFLMSTSNKFKKHKETDDLHSSWSVDDRIAKHIHTILLGMHKNISKSELIKEEEIMNLFIKDLVELEEKYRSNKDIIKSYLSLSKKLKKNPLNEWGHVDNSNIRIRGVKDYAYLVLRQVQKPTHFRDIAKLIDITFHKRVNTATIHNELIKDKRFMLYERGVYVLREWGHISGTVKELIMKIIKDNGGKANKEEIVSGVLKLRTVKENTILVNLSSSKNFIKHNGNIYSIA